MRPKRSHCTSEGNNEYTSCCDTEYHESPVLLELFYALINPGNNSSDLTNQGIIVRIGLFYKKSP